MPQHVYITFEEEKDYQKAINVKYMRICCYTRGDKNWFGKPVHFKIASEPSDIIWENQYQAKTQYYTKAVVSAFIIAACLLLAFWLFFVLQKEKEKYSELYPSSVNCKRVKDLYPK